MIIILVHSSFALSISLAYFIKHVFLEEGINQISCCWNKIPNAQSFKEKILLAHSFRGLIPWSSGSKAVTSWQKGIMDVEKLLNSWNPGREEGLGAWMKFGLRQNHYHIFIYKFAFELQKCLYLHWYCLHIPKMEKDC